MVSLKPKIYIRVDGGYSIGLGHLVRCEAIALMLNVEFEIIFYCKSIPESFISDLNDNNLVYILINDEDEFFDQVANNTIVILDGYHFDTEYQKKVKAKGAKLVCIDDLHNKEFIADLIINHAPGISSTDYKAQPYTQYALGLNYSLLRPAFLEQAKKQRTIDKMETVMICFGGSDYLNLTQSILPIVLEFPHFTKIIVVTGSNYKETDSLIQFIDNNFRIDYRHALNEQQMLDAMMVSDLAIVPASGILFEVLAAGCIVISGSYIDNQKFVYNNFKNAKCIVDAGNFSHQKMLNAISKLSGVFKNKPKIIDGHTAIRVLKLFEQLHKEFFVQLRMANAHDIDLTFNWATNPIIRRFSFQQHQIVRSEHYNWFLNKLMDINCSYSIIEYNEQPIGSIRFDIQEGEAIISYLLDPKYHGKGLGQLILKKGIEWIIVESASHKVPIKVISGDVIKTNFPSIKAFERLGFIKKKLKNNYKFEKWI